MSVLKSALLQSWRRGHLDDAQIYTGSMVHWQPALFLETLQDFLFEEIGLANLPLVYEIACSLDFFEAILDQPRPSSANSGPPQVKVKKAKSTDRGAAMDAGQKVAMMLPHLVALQSQPSATSRIQIEASSAIQRAGGMNAMLRLSRKLCETVKDRTSDDLVQLCSFYQGVVVDATLDKESILLSTSEPLINRVLAGWWILGSQKIHNPLVRQGGRDSQDYFMDLQRQLGIPRELLEIMDHGYHHGKAGILTLGLLSQVKAKEMSEREKKHEAARPPLSFDQPMPPEVRTVSNSITVERTASHGCGVQEHLTHGSRPHAVQVRLRAVDWSTAQGRQHINAWIGAHSGSNSLSPRSSALRSELTQLFGAHDIPSDAWAVSLGYLLFRASGQTLARRSIYPTALEVAQLSEVLLWKKVSQQTQPRHHGEPQELSFRDAFHGVASRLSDIEDMMLESLGREDTADVSKRMASAWASRLPMGAVF